VSFVICETIVKRQKLGGRKEGRKEVLDRGGPNEERTGTVLPTYTSQMYATVIRLLERLERSTMK
jgi:hypothetical protein